MNDLKDTIELMLSTDQCYGKVSIRFRDPCSDRRS